MLAWASFRGVNVHRQPAWLHERRPRRIEESVVLSNSHFARLQLTPTARMPLKRAGPTLNVGQTRASAGEDSEK
jgi:hypothetical protein